MEPSLETSIGKLNLSRPVMLASGILGISLDVFDRLYKSGAGAIVTKSLSREPWEGYSNPTVFSTGNGGWINAVGLSNPGATNFATMIRNNVDTPIIPSLVGSIPEDFEFMVEQFNGCRVMAYELNLSCPHVAKVGLEVGDDLKLVKEIINTIKDTTNIPIIAKIGLGNTNYHHTVNAAIDSGVDAITAINTIRAIAIDAETQRPILSNKFGGLSGSPIKHIAQRCVFEIATKHKIPIIGCGGISTWEDAVEFILAGASALQVGSAIGSSWMNTFDVINQGIIQYMKKKGYNTIQEMVGLATR